MRNTLTLLSELLTPAQGAKKLSKVLYLAGDNLWQVADAISGKEQTVSASGLNIGDYVLHDDNRLLNNLGPVTITTAVV